MRRFGSKPAEKSGQNIPKYRCRTTIAEPVGETLAELPFIGDQVVCLSHDQAGGEAGRKEGSSCPASGGATLLELAGSCDRSISKMLRATRAA